MNRNISIKTLKNQAKLLKDFLSEFYDLKHTNALHIVARMHGFDNWNIVSRMHGVKNCNTASAILKETQVAEAERILSEIERLQYELVRLNKEDDESAGGEI